MSDRKEKIIYIALSAIVLMTVAAACARTEKTAETGWETSVSMISQTEEETVPNLYSSVMEKEYFSVKLSGEQDKDTFLRTMGISEEDVPIYRYGREGTQLIVYYDEQSGNGLGLYYTETGIIGFDIPECEQEAWQDMRYDVTRDGSSVSEAENYQENREYNESGRLIHFESRGIVDAPPKEPCEDTLIEIEFRYRDDGTLEQKRCYYNGDLFGTYRGTETYHYDEQERLEYVYAHTVTHGGLEDFYIYGETGDVPLYCLTVDRCNTDARTYSFVRFVNENSD